MANFGLLGENLAGIGKSIFENGLLQQREQAAQAGQLQNSLLEAIKTNPDMADRLASSGMTHVGPFPISMFQRSPQEKVDQYIKSITSADSPDKLPSAGDIDAFVGTLGGKVPPGVADALKRQRDTRFQMMQANINPQAYESYDPATGAKNTQYARPFEMEGKTLQQTPTTEQSINAANATNLGTAFSAASAAGEKAGAVSDAEQANKLALERARAGADLANEKAMVNYRNEHPATSAQERNRASTATAGLGFLAETQKELKYLNDRGVIGPVASRANAFFTGKVGSEDLVRGLVGDGLTPQDAYIASRFLTSARLTASMAAVAHGGARGGGSVQMSKVFENMLSPNGDMSIVSGRFDALRDLLEHYRNNPGVVYTLPIPGIDTAAPQFTAAPTKPAPLGVDFGTLDAKRAALGRK